MNDHLTESRVAALPSLAGMVEAATPHPTAALAGPRLSSRIRDYVRRQWPLCHPRLWLVQAAVALIPRGPLGNIRAALYRMAGFEIGPKTYITGLMAVRSGGGVAGRLSIGRDSRINGPVHFDVGGRIEIGERVGIGHHTSIVTTNHQLGGCERRAGALLFQTVRVGDGAWIGAHAIIAPGVTVGAGAVVAIGSVVTRDIPANARAAGNPARVMGWVDDPQTLADTAAEKPDAAS